MAGNLPHHSIFITIPTMLGRAHSLLLILVSGWLVLIAAPALIFKQYPALAAAIYFLFAKVCHQLPDRSFQFFEIQIAVCHRCFGIYFGFWLGVLFWPFLRRSGLILLSKPRLILIPVALLILHTFLSSTPLERMAIGVLTGFPVALFIWIALDQVLGLKSRGDSHVSR